ncbi:hypothetical protein BJH93_00410 [Kocuria polaris]|nr:hypothetical protein [Kocuria polaris]
MDFENELLDRAAGTLLGLATGDALGAGYAAAPPHPAESAVEMIGGGPAGFAPGEWTDDAALAIVTALAFVDARGESSRRAQDLMVAGWWERAQHARSLGAQTRKVLASAARIAANDGRKTPTTADALVASQQYAQMTDLTGGNGSLVRTAPVALAHLAQPPSRAANAAVRISALTHVDQRANEACGIWTAAVHHAIHTGSADIRAGLEWLPSNSTTYWLGLIEEAERAHPEDFPDSGWVVHAFQAAWSAIHHSTAGAGATGSTAESVRAGLEAAVRAGNDTDAVGAIAGSLLGAAHGAGALPPEWTSDLHGWPDATAADLVALAGDLASGGAHEPRARRSRRAI